MKSSRVLVTGADGFIGGYLVRELLKSGIDVYKHGHGDGDLTQKEVLEKYKDIDVIYHLASRTFVPESWQKPYDYLNDNNQMLLEVLEYCRKHGSKLVYMSSYLYGEPQYLPVDENHRITATTPYHLSKKNGEETCFFYAKSFGLDIAVIRPFNVYGLGQSEAFLLPKVYKQISNPAIDKVEVFDLAPKRDYVYVEDLTRIMTRLIPYIRSYNVYNIGSGRSYSVEEVIRIIQDELGTDKEVVEKHEHRKNEVMDCVADNSRITSVIGDLEITSLRDGIHKWHDLEENC